jgi:hypothetical protein
VKKKIIKKHEQMLAFVLQRGTDLSLLLSLRSAYRGRDVILLGQLSFE